MPSPSAELAVGGTWLILLVENKIFATFLLPVIKGLHGMLTLHAVNDFKVILLKRILHNFIAWFDAYGIDVLHVLMIKATPLLICL